jgi:G6PDH family F420-dependent oxidoreductase
LAQTRRLTFGTITVPGGWRYHPVILAQAIATLGEMFPGRVPWIALGSGEAINEHVVGQPWPDKTERNARLREGAEIVRSLLRGETVTHRGRLSVVDATIWSRPDVPARLVGAATTEPTAEWLGSWADGLLTVGQSVEQVKRIIDAFRRGGGEGKPIHLKLDLSWAPTDAEALRQAHCHWRFNVLGADASWDLRSPSDFDKATRFVRPDDMRDSVLVCSDPGAIIDSIARCAEIGIDSVDLHNVGTNQVEFIEMCGTRVLPGLHLT